MACTDYRALSGSTGITSLFMQNKGLILHASPSPPLPRSGAEEARGSHSPEEGPERKGQPGSKKKKKRPKVSVAWGLVRSLLPRDCAWSLNH